MAQRKFPVIPECRKPFDYYTLQHRILLDCAGWSGPDYAAERGAEWMRVGLGRLPSSQIVFATDYPQAVRARWNLSHTLRPWAGYGRKLGKFSIAPDAEKLIPNLKERLKNDPAATACARRGAGDYLKRSKSRWLRGTRAVSKSIRKGNCEIEN